jgi:hypothetical protein
MLMFHFQLPQESVFNWLKFVQDLVPVVIGSALGISLAMWWDKRKARAETKDKRIRTIDMISGEIERLLASPDSPWETTPAEGGGVQIYPQYQPFR